ncbi:imidazole glycerol phosphate synthase subunit HisH [Candidatus Micrarchaeota archaeon]|nr:imidazole glycerol phosphate synthase subunit HisH [Candidatus Micrarchaeota archaeon]
MRSVAIIDYKAGNLRSISQAFKKFGVKPVVTASAEDIENADYVVLPGVGAFSCVDNLIGLSGAIYNALRKKPFLGICLGMQALFDRSEEAGNDGLKVFRGKVKRLRGKVKIPHIGWNTVEKNRGGSLFSGIGADAYFYFVHSYSVEPTDRSIVAGTTKYGGSFVSAIEKDNVFATQFHPEKSGKDGLRILKNFLDL